MGVNETGRGRRKAQQRRRGAQSATDHKLRSDGSVHRVCRVSRRAARARSVRACARHLKEGRKHYVRLRRCSCVHCTGYGASAVHGTSLVLCPFCVWGAAESHGGRKQSPPYRKGVTPAAARSIHFSSSRCARAEKVPGTAALPSSHSLGSRRPGVSLPFESRSGDSTPFRWSEALSLRALTLSHFGGERLCRGN